MAIPVSRYQNKELESSWQSARKTCDQIHVQIQPRSLDFITNIRTCLDSVNSETASSGVAWFGLFYAQSAGAKFGLGTSLVIVDQLVSGARST